MRRMRFIDVYKASLDYGERESIIIIKRYIKELSVYADRAELNVVSDILKSELILGNNFKKMFIDAANSFINSNSVDEIKLIADLIKTFKNKDASLIILHSKLSKF